MTVSTMCFLVVAVVLASSVHSELSNKKLEDTLKLLLGKRLTDQDPRCPDMPGAGICMAPTCGRLSGGRECPGVQVCCGNGCTYMCADPKPTAPPPTTTPVTSKQDPGCPDMTGRAGICMAPMCGPLAGGRTCPEGRICCSNGCSMMCFDKPKTTTATPRVVTQKQDPACPDMTGRAGICMAPTCGPLSGGRTCPEGRICCSNGCSMMCFDNPKTTTAPPTDGPPPVVVVRVSARHLGEGEKFTAECGVLGPHDVLYYIFRVNHRDYKKSVSSTLTIYDAKKKSHDGTWTCVAVTLGNRWYSSLNSASVTVVGKQSSWTDSFINAFWRELKRGASPTV